MTRCRRRSQASSGWAPGFRDREGCIDITPLNPPPSRREVFSYFERLPLPQLTTQHQPPGNGLSGLPVIFYTDSPTTQTFTVDIRGFTVVIEATAEQFTWHTGDATGQIVTTDPGAPYPDQTIEHSYRSGTYTAYLTVTWGATFTRQRQRRGRRPRHDDHRRAAGDLRRPPGPAGPHQPVQLSGVRRREAALDEVGVRQP